MNTLEMKHQKVKVYRNLHRKCLSVKEGNLVKAHAQVVILDDVKFIVQPGGRKRCLETKRKNVHAFVVGKIISYTDQYYTPMYSQDAVEITYNPYKSDSFYIKKTGESVKAASVVAVRADSILAWGVEI